MSYSFLVDTTLCTGCRACQVACKQWHNLPAEKTVNRGNLQNPEDLSFWTYKLVRMQEQVVGGKLQLLFFPDQCRHCLEPPCRDTAGEPTAIFSDEASGAVIYTSNTKGLAVDEIRESCPYDIPRAEKEGTLAKCDMCLDRVENGLPPACVKTCPTGAMAFGKREEILERAKSRLAEVKRSHPEAVLIDPDEVRVIYLVAFKPELYHKSAIAANTGESFGMTRMVALRRLLGPARVLARLG
jgi:formate dehydrogenase iron-sulfur subunit